MPGLFIAVLRIPEGEYITGLRTECTRASREEENVRGGACSSESGPRGSIRGAGRWRAVEGSTRSPTRLGRAPEGKGFDASCDEPW